MVVIESVVRVLCLQIYFLILCLNFMVMERDEGYYLFFMVWKQEVKNNIDINYCFQKNKNSNIGILRRI